MEVESGKTYLLRIVNAALNDELFFAIAGHNMTVVEIDAVYTKPFTTQAILIAPGQTTNVLVKADQSPSRYFMAARPFMDAPIPVDNKTVTAILQYKGIPNTVLPTLPSLPAPSDTNFALNYSSKLRSLNTPQYPANVPLRVDRSCVLMCTRITLLNDAWSCRLDLSDARICHVLELSLQSSLFVVRSTRNSREVLEIFWVR